ncbi:MAG TPA: GrpB family protein [Solirubrobacteraceae bacterium]|nr:GrpB family protein [Solirubrobacteraceae bacterium]
MPPPMLTAKDITTFCDDLAPPGADPYVPGQAPSTKVDLVPYDPAWPRAYERVAALIRGALGPAALDVAHVGSTSVPGLDAKPIIDIDLTVADNDDEAAYVPKLESHGFTLVLNEYWWYGHRLLRHDDPRANVHIWAPDCPEAARHLIFRDWLRAHPDDRQRYLEAKQAAVTHTNQTGGHTNDYNAHKQAVIREIYARAFAALGLL